MIRILDGPAGGREFACQRAPIFLRVVVDETTGRADVLDLLDDTPAPSERVSVYERVPGSFMPPTFACSRGTGRGCWTVAHGEYAHRADVDGEALRLTDAWQEWASRQSHPDAVAA